MGKIKELKDDVLIIPFILQSRKMYRVSYHLPQTNFSEFHGHHLRLPGTDRLINIASSHSDLTAGHFRDKAVLTTGTWFPDNQAM